MKLILGSGSTWRQKVLRDAGYTFDVMTADIDEKAIRYEDPGRLVLAIARAKTAAILPKIQESALLVTSDQVIVWNGVIREKPRDADEARAFLKSYAEHAPETVTSLVVTNTQTKKVVEGVDRVCVVFSSVPDNIIDALIQKGLLMTAAGGFQVQDPLLKPYIQYDGAEESCMGMPLTLLTQLLRAVQ
ncbi:Maf family protein [Candidatus Uhrbacteria bacterium]|nr:Maf family protein [Candidatus Uhrbacteria bacterium]